MSRFLSWDCANKTLAYSHFTIDVDARGKAALLVNALEAAVAAAEQCVANTEASAEALAEALSVVSALITALDAALRGFIVFHSSGVVDILGGKKVVDVGEVERTALLYQFLSNSDVSAAALGRYDGPLTVVIEHQPPKIGAKTNNKSTIIEHQLILYYTMAKDTALPGLNIELVSPKVKSKLTLGPGLRYEDFVADQLSRKKNRSDAVYQARKLHSKESFLRFVKTFDCEGVLVGVPKACLDDLADTVMQVLGYLAGL